MPERHSRTSAIVLLAGCALASCACAASGSVTAAVPSRLAVPARNLPCGSTVTGRAGGASPADRIQLSITAVRRTGTSITVSYAVNSPYRDQPLPLPIGPTAPTALLITGAVIAASQGTPPPSPLPSGLTDGGAPQAYVLGGKPYRGDLTLTRLCPGQSWRTVWQDAGRYQVAVVMSRHPTAAAQNPAPATPGSAPDPLIISTDRLG